MWLAACQAGQLNSAVPPPPPHLSAEVSELCQKVSCENINRDGDTGRRRPRNQGDDGAN